jgi:LacI family transcriptional regulator
MARKKKQPPTGQDGKAVPISIREVARRAGVSLGTVSHVLNRPEIVREHLRERVQSVIDEYGYRPNAVAKSLRQGKTRTIGLVLSDITTPFAGKLARAVEDVATGADMSVVFADTDERIDREERAVNIFFDKGIDGLILAPAPGPHLFLKSYEARGMPIVAVNRIAEDVNVPAVLPENFDGADAATRHLIEHGHRRIAVVSPQIAPRSSRERFEGYLHALSQAGIAYEEDLLAQGDWSERGGTEAIGRLLRCKDRPTAVLSFSSLMTLGVIVGLREEGVRLPHDMALIGFDEAAWSEAMSPSLTSVNLKADLVGRTATRLLLDWIAQGRWTSDQKLFRVPTELLKRESCGCVHPQTTRRPNLENRAAAGG